MDVLILWYLKRVRWTESFRSNSDVEHLLHPTRPEHQEPRLPHKQIYLYAFRHPFQTFSDNPGQQIWPIETNNCPIISTDTPKRRFRRCDISSLCWMVLAVVCWCLIVFCVVWRRTDGIWRVSECCLWTCVWFWPVWCRQCERKDNWDFSYPLVKQIPNN